MCEACVFRHGEGAAEIRPVAQVFRIQVVHLGIHGLHLDGNALQVAEGKVPEQFYGIERRECFGEVRVEFLHLALAEYLGVVLEVVRDERLYLVVFLRLLYGHVVIGAVAQVKHVDGAVEFFFGLVFRGERVLGARELDFALHVFLEGEPELVAQPREVCLGVFVGEAGVAVFLCHGIELVLVQLVEQVVQKPDARDVLGTRCRPRDGHQVALVLVVGARVVELVHVLEHVVVVLEHAQVVPVMLERECVEYWLPAGTELAQRLETAVEVRVVETALACHDHAVLYGDKAALQYGFGLNLARHEPVHLGLVHDAHQEDGALLDLVPEHCCRVLAHLLAEFLDGLCANLALELAKAQA